MKIKLQNYEKHLNEKLKNPKFKQIYELEVAKVALAQKIAEIREEHKLTQGELARKMKVSQQYISQIESGNGNNLTIETICRVVQCLGYCVNITFKHKKAHKPCLLVA